MSCSRCNELPKINFGNAKVYLKVPTKHHLKPIKNLIESLGIKYHFEKNYFLFKVIDFKKFILDIEKLKLNDLDQEDIKILPMNINKGLTFESLEDIRSLKTWMDFYKSEDVLDVLKNGKIKVLFQPIIDIKNKKVYGYEALSRGITSNGKQINPGRLFKKAKDLDLVFFLDRLCRESIIKRASELNLIKKLFINFLPTAIYDPRKCLKSTDKVVKKTKIDPNQITFEVVETEYIKNYDHLNYILDYYKEKGYSTALDDIGSGYSNKESFLSLTPDYMKIDMNIIQGIHKDKNKQERLKKYLKLANDKNIKTLAEGIEIKEDLEYVIKSNIDLAQGYYFSKPQNYLKSLDIKMILL
ncbi:MAG: EAL domain-containing protein [Bacillota bacterium]